MLQPTLRRLRDCVKDYTESVLCPLRCKAKRSPYILVVAWSAAGDRGKPAMLSVNQRETVGGGQETARAQQKM